MILRFFQRTIVHLTPAFAAGVLLLSAPTVLAASIPPRPPRTLELRGPHGGGGGGEGEGNGEGESEGEGEGEGKSEGKGEGKGEGEGEGKYRSNDNDGNRGKGANSSSYNGQGGSTESSYGPLQSSLPSVPTTPVPASTSSVALPNPTSPPPATSPQAHDSTPDGSHALPTTTVVISVLLFLCLLVIATIYYHHRKRQQRKKKSVLFRERRMSGLANNQLPVSSTAIPPIPILIRDPRSVRGSKSPLIQFTEPLTPPSRSKGPLTFDRERMVRSPPKRTMSESESMALTHSSSSSSSSSHSHSHSRSHAAPTISSSSSEAASLSGKSAKTYNSASTRSSTSSAAAYASLMRSIYSGEAPYGPVPRKDVPLIITTPPTPPQSVYAGSTRSGESGSGRKGSRLAMSSD